MTTPTLTFEQIERVERHLDRCARTGAPPSVSLCDAIEAILWRWGCDVLEARDADGAGAHAVFWARMVAGETASERNTE